MFYQSLSQQNNALLQSQQPEINISGRLHLMKINYLISQKSKLETQIHELRLNNQLLREINKKIANKSQANLKLSQLMERNLGLERQLKAMVEENRKIGTDNFLMQQVCLENQKQQREIFRNYEYKILELRKAIQVKETNIQSLEQRLPEQNWVALRANKLEFFQQVEDFRTALKESLDKNKRLVEQNQQLSKQLKLKNEKLERIERLTATKCSYLEFKDLMDGQRVKSVPKSKIQTHLPKEKQIYHSKTPKNNPESTCQDKPLKSLNTSIYPSDNFQTSSPETRVSSYILNRIIKQKLQEVRKMSQKLRNLEQKSARLENQNKKLIKSNQVYQNSRRGVVERCKRYQGLLAVMFSYLGARGALEGHGDGEGRRVYDDLFGQGDWLRRVKDRMEDAKIERISRQQWQKMSKALEGKKPLPQTPKRLHRTLSSLLDYLLTPNPNPGHSPTPEQFSIDLEDSNIGDESIRIGGKSTKQKEKENGSGSRGCRKESGNQRKMSGVFRRGAGVGGQGENIFDCVLQEI